jgi:hypothetical protein
MVQRGIHVDIKRSLIRLEQQSNQLPLQEPGCRTLCMRSRRLKIYSTIPNRIITLREVSQSTSSWGWSVQLNLERSLKVLHGHLSMMYVALNMASEKSQQQDEL